MKAVITPEGIERLRTLYAVMAGLPDKKVGLRDWRSIDKVGVCAMSNERLRNECGTAACMLGWATAYPPFVKLGLCSSEDGPHFGRWNGMTAGAEFFGLNSYRDAFALFDWSVGEPSHDAAKADPTVLFCRKDEPNAGVLSERKIALRRIRRLLWSAGVISEARNAELATEEGPGALP